MAVRLWLYALMKSALKGSKFTTASWSFSNYGEGKQKWDKKKRCLYMYMYTYTYKAIMAIYFTYIVHVLYLYTTHSLTTYPTKGHNGYLLHLHVLYLYTTHSLTTYPTTVIEARSLLSGWRYIINLQSSPCKYTHTQHTHPHGRLIGPGSHMIPRQLRVIDPHLSGTSALSGWNVIALVSHTPATKVWFLW